MRYLSTRGHADRKRFCEILLEGLAPDGGLYLPEAYPQISAAELARLRQVHNTQGYAALAFEVLSLYIDDIPANDLRAFLVHRGGVEVVDLHIRGGAHRVRHGAGVFWELSGAQHAHVLDALDRAR